MDKIVNDAHTSKLQTLQNYYEAEDVLVFDIESSFLIAFVIIFSVLEAASLLIATSLPV